jgi:hypothetical protein
MFTARKVLVRIPKHIRKEFAVKRIHVVILVFLCFAMCLMATGSRATGDRITFLNIRMVDGELTLESVKVVEGSLKIPRTLHLEKGKLYCEVLDVSGKPIFETVVHDPSIERLEYADAEGRLHSKVVAREDAFFSIRIPYDPAARTVDVYRIDASHDGGRLIKRANRIGSLRIDPSGGGHE